MTLGKRENNCPVCGTLSRMELKSGAKNCISCGTVYNKFGVIMSSDMDDENMQLN